MNVFNIRDFNINNIEQISNFALTKKEFNISIEQGEKLIKQEKQKLIGDVEEYKFKLEIFSINKKILKLENTSILKEGKKYTSDNKKISDLRFEKQELKNKIINQRADIKKELEDEYIQDYFDKELLNNIRFEKAKVEKIKSSSEPQQSDQGLEPQLQKKIEEISSDEYKLNLISQKIEELGQNITDIENFKEEIIQIKTTETDDGSNNALKSKIKENRNNNRLHFYVVEGKIKSAPSHWFSVIQQNNKIEVFDSLGDKRKDFSKTFLNDVEHVRNKNPLQTSSGVCEMYAIKGFDLIRAKIFNSLSKRNTEIMDTERELDYVFELGLSENAFGQLKGKQTIIVQKSERLKIIDNQISLLEKKNSDLNYSSRLNDTFNKKFIEDLKKAEDSLLFMDKDIQIKKFEIAFNLYKESFKDDKNFIKLFNTKANDLQNNLIKIYNNEKQTTLLDLNERTFEKEFENVSFEQYNFIKQKFQDIGEKVKKELKNHGKFNDDDLGQGNFSLKAGYMYWQTVSVLKKFEEKEVRESE